jgi:hypothetical protein
MPSLKLIDTRIDRFRKEGLSSDCMEASMTALGAYVGETIRRTVGHGEWIEDAWLGPWPILDCGKVKLNPIGKCCKRLDDGPADSVSAFGKFVTLDFFSERSNEKL